MVVLGGEVVPNNELGDCPRFKGLVFLLKTSKKKNNSLRKLHTS